MIRDLRYEEIERAQRRGRLIKVGVLLVLTSAAATFVVSREREIHEEWSRIPEARDGDLDSLKARHAAIETMLAKRSFWTGVFKASEERDELVVAISNEERMLADAARRAEGSHRRMMEEVEALRARSLILIERREYARAIEQLERAMELAGEGWEHREQVQVDIEALRGRVAEAGDKTVSQR